MIDEEISTIVESAYTKAVQILTDNQDGLTQLANKLLEKEVIFGEDLEQIFGKRQWVREEIPHVVNGTEYEQKLPSPAAEDNAGTSN